MKNYIREQLTYLQDNPEGHWFKRKLYGWGWTPATWQGWAIVGLFIAFIFCWIWYYESQVGIEFSSGKFFLPIGLAISLLVIISWRSGGAPRWQWGNVDDNQT